MAFNEQQEQGPTVVETYLIDEVKALIYDDGLLTEWENKIKKLKLSGQTELRKTDKSPIPFLHMKKGLYHIFSELCPQNCPAEEFSVTPIPLEVLDLIELAKREKYFQWIDIWWDDEKPDPLAVGIIGHWYETGWYSDSNKELKGKKFNTKEAAIKAGAKHPNSLTEDRYLIARWGDMKRSFNELKNMAINRFREVETARINRQIKKHERELEDIEEKITDRFQI